MMNQLDEQLLNLLIDIEQSYRRLPRHLQIRTEKWVERLSVDTKNWCWKKQLVQYAECLYRVIRVKDFRVPFDKAPGKVGSESNLPPLPVHFAMGASPSSNPPYSSSSRSISPPQSASQRKFWSTVYHRLHLRGSGQSSSTKSIDFQQHRPSIQRDPELTLKRAITLQALEKTPKPLSVLEISNRAIQSLQQELATERQQHESLLCEIQACRRAEATERLAREEAESAMAQCQRDQEQWKKDIELQHAHELDQLSRQHEQQVRSLTRQFHQQNQLRQLHSEEPMNTHDPTTSTTEGRVKVKTKTNVVEYLKYIEDFQQQIHQSTLEHHQELDLAGRDRYDHV